MNNKMKKFNKILMMTVAILLTLVLASTSVVSGIFAKYVVTKSAETTVSLKAFGLVLTASGGKDLPSGVSATPSSNGLKVTVSNLSLLPGQSIDEAVKFTISADGAGSKPNVDKVNLKITVDVSGENNFNVTTSNVAGITNGTYIPIGFKANISKSETATAKTILSAWSNSTAIENSVASGIKTNFTNIDKVTNNVVEEVIWDTTATPSTTELGITYLGFGFYCYGKETTTNISNFSTTQADAVQTYLSTNSNAKLTVTYTVSLEQVVTT